MTTLYNCKREIDATGSTRFRITKFDSNMEVESSYLTDGAACECPAGERSSCRHRDMLPKFLARGAVNTNWFYDFNRDGWVQMGMAETPEQAIEAMDNCPYWNGEKSLSQPHSVEASTEDFGSSSAGSIPAKATKIERRGF